MTKMMEKLALARPDELVPYSIGTIVDATVISVNKNRVLVNVADAALGMIPEKEFSYDTDDLQTGDKVSGQVILTENKDGFVILSFKRADKERVWTTLQNKKENSEPIKVKITSANRGGLVVEFGGIEGFIPVSQLSSANYPKVSADQQGKILQSLRKMIDTTMMVKIITLDQTNNKLILSEKKAGDEVVEKAAKSVDIGTKLSGTITGVVDFGLFVKVNIPGENNNVEGLVHISEVSWDRVENISDQFKPGQQVDVVVIDNKDGRLSLSIKRLLSDPFDKFEKEFKQGDKITGEVTRLTPFGAFVKLPHSIDGLVHISQMGENVTDPKTAVKENEKYEFSITEVDHKGRKISLSLKDEKKSTKADKEKTSKTKEKEVKETKVAIKPAKKPAKIVKPSKTVIKSPVSTKKTVSTKTVKK